jgi:hypothetical protein
METMDENTCVACGCDIPEGRHVCAKCEAGVVSRADILDEAKHIVTHDRNEQYGGPEDSFTAIAAIWEAQLRAFGWKGCVLTPAQAAQMMVGLKLARAATAITPKLDTFVDLAGYAACAGELVCG